MKKYKEYKDSGIEWIGEIPEHWDVKRFKHIAIINPGKDALHKDRDDDVVFLPMEKVNEDGSYNCELKKPISELWNGFTYFEEGDILIAKITPCFENGKGALLKKIDTKIGFGSTEFHVLRTMSFVTSVFLFYITRSKLFMALGEAFMTGAAGQKRVPTDFVSEFLFCFPPLSEQTAIANYLDRKTAEIDELIADKKRLLELYEEEKTAIINQAVTKGINPDVKMKDSGIEWLGEIPEHWEVKKLKLLVLKIGSGVTPSGGSSVYQTSGIPLLRSQNVHFDGLKLDDVAYISEKIDEGMNNSRVQENDVLLNITGASIGRCFYVPLGFGRGNVNQHVCIIRPIIQKVNVQFLYYQMRSIVGQHQISLQQTGANREGLNFEQLKNFHIPNPVSTGEQAAIVDYIKIETARIDAKKSRTEKLIDLLTEFRTALISEVVTGKFKVVE